MGKRPIPDYEPHPHAGDYDANMYAATGKPAAKRAKKSAAEKKEAELRERIRRHYESSSTAPELDASRALLPMDPINMDAYNRSVTKYIETANAPLVNAYEPEMMEMPEESNAFRLEQCGLMLKAMEREQAEMYDTHIRPLLKTTTAHSDSRCIVRDHLNCIDREYPFNCESMNYKHFEQHFGETGHALAIDYTKTYVVPLHLDLDCRACKEDQVHEVPDDAYVYNVYFNINETLRHTFARYISERGLQLMVYRAKVGCGLHIYTNVSVSSVAYTLIASRVANRMPHEQSARYHVDATVTTFPLPCSSKRDGEPYERCGNIGAPFTTTLLPQYPFFDVENLCLVEEYSHMNQVLIGDFCPTERPDDESANLDGWVDLDLDDTKASMVMDNSELRDPTQLHLTPRFQISDFIRHLRSRTTPFTTEHFVQFGAYLNASTMEKKEYMIFSTFKVEKGHDNWEEYSYLMRLSVNIAAAAYNETAKPEDSLHLHHLISLAVANNASEAFYVIACAVISTVKYILARQIDSNRLAMNDEEDDDEEMEDGDRDGDRDDGERHGDRDGDRHRTRRPKRHRRMADDICARTCYLLEQSFSGVSEKTAEVEMVIVMIQRMQRVKWFAEVSNAFPYPAEVLKHYCFAVRANFYPRNLDEAEKMVREYVWGALGGECDLETLLRIYFKRLCYVIKPSNSSMKGYAYNFSGEYHMIPLYDLKKDTLLGNIIRTNMKRSGIISKDQTPLDSQFNSFIASVRSHQVNFGRYSFFINTKLGVFNTITGLYQSHSPFLYFTCARRIATVPLHHFERETATMAQLNRQLLDEHDCLSVWVSSYTEKMSKLFYLTVMVPGLLRMRSDCLSLVMANRIFDSLYVRIINERLTQKEDNENFYYLPALQRFEHCVFDQRDLRRILVLYNEVAKSRRGYVISQIVTRLRMYDMDLTRVPLKSSIPDEPDVDFCRDESIPYSDCDMRALMSLCYIILVLLRSVYLEKGGGGQGKKLGSNRLTYTHPVEQSCFAYMRPADKERQTSLRGLFKWVKSDDDLHVRRGTAIWHRALRAMFNHQLPENLVSMMQMMAESMRYDGTATTDLLTYLAELYQPKCLRKHLIMLIGYPASGKSTLASICASICQPATYMTVSVFNDKNNGAGPSPEMMTILNSYLTVLNEVDMINASFLKTLTGNDAYSRRNLYQSEIIAAVPYCCFIGCANAIPAMKNADAAVRDRLYLALFEATAENTQNSVLEPNPLVYYAMKKIPQRVFNEHSMAEAMSNIIFMHHFKHRLDTGLVAPMTTSPKSVEMLNTFMRHNSEVYHILHQCQLVVRPDLHISLQTLRERVEKEVLVTSEKPDEDWRKFVYGLRNSFNFDDTDPSDVIVCGVGVDLKQRAADHEMLHLWQYFNVTGAEEDRLSEIDAKYHLKDCELNDYDVRLLMQELAKSVKFDKYRREFIGVRLPEMTAEEMAAETTAAETTAAGDKEEKEAAGGDTTVATIASSSKVECDGNEDISNAKAKLNALLLGK